MPLYLAFPLPPGEGEQKGASDAEEGTMMVPVAEGIQPISNKIAQRINNGEFVDFSELLQDQLPQEDLMLCWCSQ